MPYALDTDRLADPSLTMLDINHPPSKSIPMAEFPRMVYLHPKDKAKEHRTAVVDSAHDLEAALSRGFRLQPHIPEKPAEDLSLDYDVAEFDTAEKRPVGRPRTVNA